MSFTEEQIRRIVRDELRIILDKGLMYSAESKNAPQAKVPVDVGDIALKFPEDLRRHLTITSNTIKTKFVAHELFLEMDKIAKEMGYKYISDGKNSRWEK